MEQAAGSHGPDDKGLSNIFRGHETASMVRSRSRGSKPQNEFYSHLHTPNIQSIGQFVIIANAASQAGLGAKLSFANDNTVTTNATDLITVAPRGVKLKLDDNAWCFEITIVQPGNISLGFAEVQYACMNDRM